MTECYDAIVIGLGAAGAVFASELTRSGLRVLAIEYGAEYRNHSAEFSENELAMWPLIWDSNRYEVEGDFAGVPNLGCGVGGGTLAWTGVSLRLFEHDFEFKRRFGAPPGTTVADWPVNAAELDVYYGRAERQMGVSGSRTAWAQSCRPAPNPALPLYDGSRLLAKGMEQLGLKWAPGRVATNSQAYGGRPACVNCGFCRSGCRIDAKYQADRVLVRPALDTGRLALLTETAVSRILMDASGEHAEGVEYIDRRTGKLGTARARVVIASNNPMELPRLFLNSTSRRWPNGLGNRHDQVGRNFFCHLGSVGMGVTATEQRASMGHNMGNLMSLDFAEPHAHFRGGFSMLSLSGAGAGVLAGDPLRQLHGAALQKVMRAYNRSLFMISFVEGFPSSENRISLLPSAPDELGIPRARIRYHYKPEELALFEEANQTMGDVFRAAGCQDVYLTPTPFESHPMGSMRMGRDPEKSVTNRWGRVHGVSNVFVGGAALFVTGGAVNPTLTIHALALRTAEHVVEQLGNHHRRGAHD
jgi:choline dehydrogenase-like flavoprotein